MKIGTLRSIAHNVADSLGSGIGMLIGSYNIDVFGEAKRSPGGVIRIDFLAGKATRGNVSSSLAGAIARYRKALAKLCAKHGRLHQTLQNVHRKLFGGHRPSANGRENSPPYRPLLRG